MPVLPVVAIAATVLAAGVSAYGAVQSGQASSAAASYQSQVAANNAIIANQNAQYATAAGAAQASQEQLKTAATIGAIRTNQAASGLDVNAGSNLDVQSSAKELGELNTLTIQNAAARQAYGYQTQSMSDVASGQLLSAQASQDTTAGLIGGASSVLGGASSASSEYQNYLRTGVVNPGLLSGGGAAP
jgi:hypothetical protein